MDQKLTFESHVNRIVLQANRALGLLIRSFQTGHRKPKFQKEGVIAAYAANVRSVLEFCSVIWAGAAKTHMERIERIQHKFLIWLTTRTRNAAPSLSYSDLLNEHSFTSLQARRTQHDIMFLVTLFRHRLDSSQLRSAFGLHAPGRATRNRELFHVPSPRVDTVKCSLFCRLPRHINSFLRACTALDIFHDTVSRIKSQTKLYVKTLRVV